MYMLKSGDVFNVLVRVDSVEHKPHEDYADALLINATLRLSPGARAERKIVMRAPADDFLAGLIVASDEFVTCDAWVKGRCDESHDSDNPHLWAPAGVLAVWFEDGDRKSIAMILGENE